MNRLLEKEHKTSKINLEDIVKDKLIESHLFWIGKRLFFNIAVGLSGLICLYLKTKLDFSNYDSILIILGISIWGIIANGLYSLGFELESIIIRKTKGVKNLSDFRNILFWIGTLLYIVTNLMYILIIPIPTIEY